MAEPEILKDEPHRPVVRIGDTVRRPVQPWTPAVHGLLRHLESVGFPYSPRVLGIDDEGREVLTYLEGESGTDGLAKVVDDRGLVAMARLLREYHEAVAGYRPAGARWALTIATTGAADPPSPGELICHGDFGPWNLVWRGTEPVGIIDWDYALPHPPLWDVAYALEYVAPFRDDAECLRSLRYPAPPDRRARLERFATAYGLTDLTGLADAVIDQQQSVLDWSLRLADEGHQPFLAWRGSGHFDGVAERVRWSRANRHLFSAAPPTSASSSPHAP
ncbi:aminoglycoside phosphotransferase family protein [Virgisporangium ochraceum]|nr:aminoglycoside phosphotransferase family protein [Virgisporangium ochraceum]